MKPVRRKWTAKELKLLKDTSVKTPEVALRTGRTRSAVASKRTALGVSTRKRRPVANVQIETPSDELDVARSSAQAGISAMIDAVQADINEIDSEIETLSDRKHELTSEIERLNDVWNDL